MTTQRLPKPTMVASDVDGTLLDEHERLSARTKAAAAAVVADGVPFVLATGRPPRWVHPVVDGLGFEPICVCGNGAVIYDSATDRILHADTLDVDTLTWIAELAERVLPGCGLASERVGASAHDAVTPQFVSTLEYQHAWLNPDNMDVSRAEVVEIPAIKLLIRRVGAQSRDMVAALTPHLYGRVAITYSTDDGLIEVAAPGVTKASGLARVADRLAVDRSGILAFGDMPNDITMLLMAGHGVAMGNADPAAKEAADEVTTANTDDGVARVLERWWN